MDMIVYKLQVTDDENPLWMVEFFRMYELTGEVDNDILRLKKLNTKDILGVPAENTLKNSV